MPIPAANIEVPDVAAARPGLLTVAAGPWVLPEHATTSGGIWEMAACTGGRLYPTACADVPYPAMEYDAREALQTAYAFNVYASEICTPVGTTDDDARRRVQQRLALGEQSAVELALWGGSTSTGTVVGVFEAMQAAGKVTTLAGPHGVVEAVSLLEQTGAQNYDGPLLLHARPRMAAHMGSRGVLESREAKRTNPEVQQTHLGTRIVFGGGYSGNSPAGVAPTATHEFMYITGRVLVWRSPKVWTTPPGQMLNQTTNQRIMHAVRTYMIGVECVVAAVEVTRAS
jgi:hypothetical protein